jgi:hypothetical protein
VPNGNENVENVRALDAQLPPGRLWNPVVGEQLRGTLQLYERRLAPEERQAIEQQTVSILGKTIPPPNPRGSETGLALGYVQSGKTLSFTCVAALASDNRFPLVIIITGTSIPLFQQSVRRLRNDLRIENPESHAWRWQFFQNPNMRQNHLTRIRDVLAEWQEPRVADKRTCLIAVMKNHRHLSNLVDLIEGLNLSNVPSLVIDDEADQAGLNTMVNQNEESRTYQRLLSLRNALPHHTFLQYTATPQAPLLINIIDVLSPRFVEVLDPGREYVGLIDFFQINRALVRTIPEDEIPSPDNELNGAPESLREALRLFLVGVAAGHLLHSLERNRSMLVHPSRLQERHANYFHWVSAVRSDWLRLLQDESDPDRVTLLNDFRRAHANLSTTYPNLPGFDQIERVLWQTINRTQVWEVNARLGRTPEVVWQSDYAHILVGGQAMDRGFTVEGLTVTYMPRGRGVGNADTIQQRARFLGYKRSYLGLCRVFLESEVQHAYTIYVDHEENLREQLRQHAADGRSLTEWRRAFFLDRTLKPTRRCVLDLNYQNVNFASEWFFPRAPHFTQASVERNRALVMGLTQSVEFSVTDGHDDRTEMQRHGYARATLTDLYESFLTQIQFANPADSQRYTGLLLQVREYLDRNPNAAATIFLMSWSSELGQVARDRSLDENAEIQSSGAFFQGASLGRGSMRQGEVYPGDREMRAADELTVQIHLLNLKASGSQNRTVAAKVPAVAIWMHADMGVDTLVQDAPA